MPRATQIIPGYDVPHVMTVVNDNSTVDAIENVVAVDPVARFLCIFPSAKGPDGCRTITSTSEYLSTYGKPDIKKYGQASFMPYLLLNTGRAHVHCMRITPADSQYANVVIMAKPETADNKVTLKYKRTYIGADDTTTLTNLEDFETMAAALTDTDGYKPLFGFVIRGRGAYGNDYVFRITSDDTTNKTSNYMNYMFNLVTKESGLDLTSYMRGTMYPASIIANQTQFLYDKINDPEANLTINMYVNEEFMDEIYDAYVAACEGANVEPVNQGEFDILLGKFRSTTNPTSGSERYAVSDVSLDVPTGVAFEGGTDGDFDMTNENRDLNIIREYLCALGYNPGENVSSITIDGDKVIDGLTDANRTRYGNVITSRRRTPTDVILDANYPDVVKKELINLAEKRFDAKLYLDSGMRSSVSDLITWDNDFTYSGGISNMLFGASTDDRTSYLITREAQWYKTRDPFTGKAINVTATWFLAQALPVHITTIGNQIPFVGERYALLTGALANSVKPNIDADDLETKQSLYERGINTFDTLSENRYIRATQVTSQTNLSDLSEDHNVLVLMEMKRMLEDMVLRRLYDFSEAEDRVRFKEDATRLFETYPNRKVRNFEVTFEMNEFEQERNILHCYLKVTFRQISTRGIVEIDINKRTV